jgi:hypothetical protein
LLQRPRLRAPALLALYQQALASPREADSAPRPWSRGSHRPRKALASGIVLRVSERPAGPRLQARLRVGGPTLRMIRTCNIILLMQSSYCSGCCFHLVGAHVLAPVVLPDRGRRCPQPIPQHWSPNSRAFHMPMDDAEAQIRLAGRQRPGPQAASPARWMLHDPRLVLIASCLMPTGIPIEIAGAASGCRPCSYRHAE